MSKIEEALNKARASRSKQLVPSVGTGSSDSNKDDRSGRKTLVSGQRELVDIESRIESGKNIARMQELEEFGHRQLILRKIIHQDMEQSSIANSFRELRTKILQKCNGHQGIIMVTSPTSGCGCSFSALNLAAAFSFDGSKTALLVDCNLRDSGLSKMLVDGDSNYGLTDYLESSELDVSKIIYPSGIKRLRIMPAGGIREVPSEYFTSFKMKTLLAEIEKRYPDRYIILDSPAILESADAHILSELIDYVLLVIPYGKFTIFQIKSAVETIDKNKLIGIIFNNEPSVPGQSWRQFIKSLFSFSSLKKAS